MPALPVARPLGVGVVGARPVAQAIHLPTLASLRSRLRPVNVMDVDPSLADAVAARVGTSSSHSLEELLADPAVDVVAICSPGDFHAAQIEQVCAAGKRGILCEKPLAMSAREAGRIAEVVRRSTVPLVVGTMHLHDPAYRTAVARWRELGGGAWLVRASIYLPNNEELIGLACDPLPAVPRSWSASPTEGDVIRGVVLGLLVHNTPLIRQVMPTFHEATLAANVAPWGAALTLTADGCTAQLHSLMPGRWSPGWRLEIFGPPGVLSVEFPPSYVLAGSARASVSTSDGVEEWHLPFNGYQAEWLALADGVEGLRELPAAATVDEAVADLVHALDIADAAATAVEAPVGGPAMSWLPGSLTVSLHHAAMDEHRMAGVLASLTAHYQPASGARSDVAVVSSRAVDWLDRVDRLLLDGRLRAIHLTGPAVAPADDVRRLAERAKAASLVVVVGSRFLSNPDWRSSLPRLHRDLTSSAVLDVLVTVPLSGDLSADLDRGLVEGCSLVRSLHPHVDALTSVGRAGTHRAIATLAGALVVSVASVASPVQRSTMTCDVVGVDHRWHLEVGHPASAAPLLISRWDEHGERRVRPTFQGGDRASLAALHAALMGASLSPGQTLQDLVGDLRLVAGLPPSGAIGADR